MRYALCLLCLLGCLSTVHAQKPVYDPYRWINDPLAIADLGGPDSAPMMRMFDAGTMKLGPADNDGKIILAADTGTGIIRHFWSVIVHQIPDPWFRLWVDDSLVIDALDSDFFTKAHGFIRAPLDSSNMGGFVCETQIPYKHSFRWTSDYTWFIRHCEWQRLDTSQYSLPAISSRQYADNLATAETNYPVTNPWSASDSIEGHSRLTTGENLILPDLTGPACIHDLHISLSRFDSISLSELWLVIQWDDCPTPSIEVPLADFFGVSRSVRSLQSFRIAVDTSMKSLDCYFPMPFRVGARISIVNRGATVADVRVVARYSALSWTRTFGYFCAQYNLTQATMRDVLHPVLHAKGAGRYIGASFGFANSPFNQAVYMEGDGYFSVDSTAINLTGLSPDYSGTEDYCNSGWYFNGTTFNRPFSGNSDWLNMYRFHITDPYNYTKSIDISWGHGFDDDYKETISTVAYFYKNWTPFYLSSDSVARGEACHITGSGYRPNTSVSIQLDGHSVSNTLTSSDGILDISIPILSEWASGSHVVSIDGQSSPDRLVILERPLITFLQDSIGQVFGEGDSIRIRGYGFRPHEHIRLSAVSASGQLDSAMFDLSPLTADSDGVFRLKAYIPALPENMYRLSASGEQSGSVVSGPTFFVTRVLDYEFEDLLAEGALNNYAYISRRQGWYSQAAIRFCFGNWQYGSKVRFQFEVPYTDSFAVRVFAITNNRYANYRMFIDGVDCGAKDWFIDVPDNVLSRDSVNLGSRYLNKGTHKIEFVNEGFHANGKEYSVGPDNMHLTPLSSVSKVARRLGSSDETRFAVFPTPVAASRVYLSNLPASADWISVVDARGFEVQRFLIGSTVLSAFELPSLSSGVYWIRVHTPYSIESRSIVVLR